MKSQSPARVSITSAKVRIWGHEATVSQWEWRCECKPLERTLNRMLRRGEIHRSVAEGNLDLRAAEYVVGQLGGEIIGWTDRGPDDRGCY